ncbi:MAG: hypothetical protein JNK92_11830 [Dechloromonas sp.]|nr:hypothetical protein [Dechloromonas sp.]
MTTNKLILNARLTDHSPPTLVTELFVDGARLAPRAVVDLRALAKSVQTSGRHWIFTCGCGTPLCADIVDSVQVRHSTDFVEWDFNFIDSLGGGVDLDDEDYERKNIRMAYRFDPDEYRKAVDLVLRDAKGLLSSSIDARSPCINFTVMDIQRLTTVVFTDRDCFADRQLASHDVVLHATDGMWITADGIPFDIDELSLSQELVSQYRHFESLECFPHNPSDLAEYEHFLNAGRAFGGALNHLLGRECSVKLWYRYGPVGNNKVWSVTEELR